MEFIMKNKKALIIGALVLVALAVWYFWSKSEPESVKVTETVKPIAMTADVQLITDRMEGIKNDPNWNAEVIRKAAINAMTYNQQLAKDAIDTLKTDGKLASSYVFVRANY